MTLFKYLTGRTSMGYSRSAFTACSAANFESRLSMDTVSGEPFLAIYFSKKRLAATLSRLALNRKSIVLPALFTARYRYFHEPITLMYVSYAPPVADWALVLEKRFF